MLVAAPKVLAATEELLCRRELAGMRTTLGSTTESLELVRCQEFMGLPGSRAPMAQPFHVHVHPLVGLLLRLPIISTSCFMACLVMNNSSHGAQNCALLLQHNCDSFTASAMPCYESRSNQMSS